MVISCLRMKIEKKQQKWAIARPRKRRFFQSPLVLDLTYPHPRLHIGTACWGSCYENSISRLGSHKKEGKNRMINIFHCLHTDVEETHKSPYPETKHVRSTTNHQKSSSIYPKLSIICPQKDKCRKSKSCINKIHVPLCKIINLCKISHVMSHSIKTNHWLDCWDNFTLDVFEFYPHTTGLKPCNIFSSTRAQLGGFKLCHSFPIYYKWDDHYHHCHNIIAQPF